ncbi:MAG TPA: RluA family pseudouridine synthase [Tepidisphaeraceae bacterium]|jgi:RluA family pseudouridine synthase
MRTPRLNIVYEDANLLVVNKPPGLLTSTNERERRPTLLAMVRDYISQQNRRFRVGLIHRLDRDASGLLVFSKNNRAYESLKKQLFHREMKRIYIAVVEGIPNPRQGRIESRLIELPDGRVVSTRRHAAGERAITDYEVLRTADNKSLLRVSLLTGRKHQIRTHLAEKGHSIIGDKMYGKPSPSPLMLCAAELAFADPVSGKPHTFRIDPPGKSSAWLK